MPLNKLHYLVTGVNKRSVSNASRSRLCYDNGMAKNTHDLQTKADEILQEIRIVLPGTEALLGFQFVIFFNPVFQGLPSTYQYIHFSTLILTMLCTILLVAPVAFQQVGEDGKITHSFLNFARRMLSVSMLFLLIALAGDIFIAAKVIELSTIFAAAVSLVIFMTGIILWYAYALLRGKVKK